MDKRAYYLNKDVANSYDRIRISTPSGQITHEHEIAAIRSVFKSTERLTELACGTGRLMRELTEDGWTITGVDQSDAMIEAAGAGLTIKRGDVFNLPLESASVDGAYCFRFTNHYADLGPFFKECSRVLRPRCGLLFDAMRWSLLRWNSQRWGGANFTISSMRLEQWLREAGLEVVWHRPLFLIGPYLISRLPLSAARALMGLSNYLPESCHAVSLWYAQKRA
jgi:ubiquinone/menaquinone biosynthesis C-methylase UbiE